MCDSPSPSRHPRSLSVPGSSGSGISTSASYHHSSVSSSVTERNPNLPLKRPRIDNASHEHAASSSATGVAANAHHVRSLTTPSSATTLPSALSADNGTESQGGAALLSLPEKKNEPVKKKDMFTSFRDTIIISMILKNWPA